MPTYNGKTNKIGVPDPSNAAVFGLETLYSVFDPREVRGKVEKKKDKRRRKKKEGERHTLCLF